MYCRDSKINVTLLTNVFCDSQINVTLFTNVFCDSQINVTRFNIFNPITFICNLTNTSDKSLHFVCGSDVSFVNDSFTSYYTKPSSHAKVNEVNKSFLFPLLSLCRSREKLSKDSYPNEQTISSPPGHVFR